MAWSGLDSLLNQAIGFAVGIVLARLLSPHEFGLVGMLAIFTTVAGSLIDGGFAQALIRKQDCTDTDYSTVFYFNIFVAAIAYAILYAGAPYVGAFFHEPLLVELLRVLSVALLIGTLGIVQRVLLIKRVNFKRIAYMSIASNLLSGGVALILAWKGFGVWSLVARTIAQRVVELSILWVTSAWRPILAFSMPSLRSMFSFGSKLLASGLLNTIYDQVYYLVVGRYYGASDLGYLSRAETLSHFPAQTITGAVQRVSYPVLARISDQPDRLRAAYRKLVRSIMLLAGASMLMVAALAQPIVVTLVGEKWLPCVPYMQVLAFVGLLFPLHAVNLNILNVLGRSDIFLLLEVIKKSLAIPVILVGITWGIMAMVYAMLAFSVVALLVNSYPVGRLLGYRLWDQLRDVSSVLWPAMVVALGVHITSRNVGWDMPVQLVVFGLTGVLGTLALLHLTRNEVYIEMEQEVRTRLFPSLS